VVQGALKLILEPIFEADFHDGSYGYRPKRQAQEAVERVRRGRSGIYDVTVSRVTDGGHADVIAEFRGRSRVVSGTLVSPEGT